MVVINIAEPVCEVFELACYLSTPIKYGDKFDDNECTVEKAYLRVNHQKIYQGHPTDCDAGGNQ